MLQVLTSEGKFIDLYLYQQNHDLNASALKPNFTVSEFSCQYQMLIALPLLDLLQSFRDEIHKAVKINSGYRSLAKQEALKKAGYKTARHSPHCQGMAADIDTSSWTQTLEYVKLFKEIAKRSKTPIRLGYRQYHAIGQTFLHIDVCPFYFAKKKPFHNQPHPVQWEWEIEW